MRSVKQVKRAHRIRSLKNAAACKRNAYRRRMQAKHNWQTNTVFTGFRLPTLNAPTPTPRKMKEAKQRTPEEIAERQRAREQKRLEKELAKQKASTSALPKPKKIKKEKRLIEEPVEKKVVQPKQQTPKKEKVKNETEEVDEKRPRVEPEKRKGTVKEPKNDTKEISVKTPKAEKKEPKVPTKELEAEKKEPDAGIKERKAKQSAPPESEADSKEKKGKQRAPRESDADTKEKKGKQRALPEPDAGTKEKKTKQRAPPESDADTKEKEIEQRAPPEPDTDTKERKAKQSAPSESVPTKSKKKGKKGAEIPMAQQQPIAEEVQLKKEEDAAPISSAPSKHQHVDDHMTKDVHDDGKGIEAPTAPEPTEITECTKENIVDEKKGEVAEGSVVVDAAKKVTVPEGPSPIAEEDGLPLNDAPVAPDDLKPAEEMPSFAHDSSKDEQIVSEEVPTVEEPALEEQHQTLAADINRASSDEKRDDEQHNEPLEHNEHVGETKGKKQRKQKGHRPESEKHDEFQQRDEHAQAIDEATKEMIGDASKKQKKKRNRKSEMEHHMPSPDEVQFVEGESIEINDADQVEGGEFTAVVSRRHKKKGRSPELENTHEETHTAEQLREVHENVEEVHEEEGKAADAKTAPPTVTIDTSNEIVEEVIPPPTVLQSCPCEGPNKEQHEHKTTEVITIGDIPSGDQVVVDKTVITLDAAGSPNQFAENVAKLAEEHPELMKNTNIELGEHITGKVTVTTFTTKTAVTQEPMKVVKRDPIVLALERDKRADLLRQRRERVYKLLPRDVEFCTRMIEAHGSDYEAMAKDPTNVHQETAKSIQRKIRIFRESPQYEAYVRSKNSSPVPPPVNG